MFLDQHFTIPQIGEVIRDMLILETLASGINRTRDSSDDKIMTNEVPILPDEGGNIMSHVQSSLLVKSSA